MIKTLKLGRNLSAFIGAVWIVASFSFAEMRGLNLYLPFPSMIGIVIGLLCVALALELNTQSK